MKERIALIIDHLGSPVMVVKYFYDTEVALEIKYDSFGKEIPTPPNTYPPPKAEASRLRTPPRRGIVGSAPLPRGDFPFGFAGGIWDKDTKLIRFGVRDYDPETGRWTSVEPLGFAGSRNWYVYAGNDGVNFVDITGLNPFKRNSNRGFGYNPHEGGCGRTFGAGISDTTSELGLKSSPVWIPAIIGMVTFGFGSAIGGTSGIIIGGGLTNINLGFISRAGESDYFSSKKIGIDFLEGVLLAKFLNYINTGLKHLPINKFIDFSYKTKAILESNACISSFNNACSGDEMDSQGWGLLLISILLSYF